MASTVSFVAKTVFGDKRVMLMRITHGDAAEVIPSGLEWVDSVQLTVSTATNAVGVGINTGASAPGDIKLSTFATSGVYHVMVIGR